MNRTCFNFLFFLSLLWSSLFLFNTSPALARTTQTAKNYPVEYQQKLENLSKLIANINKSRSEELAQNISQQGQILDEYLRRNNIMEGDGADGIHRNLNDKIANARYLITFAHEAVAYQKAMVYVFELTSQSNIKNDELKTINKFGADLNYTRSTVIKSQNILASLITKK